MRNEQLQNVVELKKKNKTFDTYSNFNEVESRELKAWNRCVTYFNAIQDIGIDEANKYAKQFTVDERKDMIRLFDMIKDKGTENIKAMVSRGDLRFI